MMTNSISLNSSIEETIFKNAAHAPASDDFDLTELLASLKPIRTLAEMYSGLMEEEISPRLTLHLLNVQLAAFFTIMPAELLVFTRILCLVWFVASISLAKNEYRKTSTAVRK